MIDNALLFAAFKAVEQRVTAEAPGKLREGVGLGLGQKPFAAVLPAVKAAVKPLFDGTAPVHAPAFAAAAVGAAAGAGDVFGAETAGKPAARDPKLAFQRRPPLMLSVYNAN